MSESVSTRIHLLSADVRNAMQGVTWHESLPSPTLSELRSLSIPHLDFQGKSQVGTLIARADLAQELVDIFAKLRDISFPIASIRPMRDFGGDDGLSMAANNSSCFNSRRIRGTTRISMHALGAAVDINPVQNPVVRGGVIRPDEGHTFRQRRVLRPGMIVDESEVVSIFAKAGWQWGGHWNNPVDYHHFFRPNFRGPE